MPGSERVRSPEFRPCARSWLLAQRYAALSLANVVPPRTQILADDILALWTLAPSVSSTAFESG